ncbi:GTPase-activating protein [Ascosphaera acerosa]|nr:GTPase-activating protein [Ascosphaera acerosa]
MLGGAVSAEGITTPVNWELWQQVVNDGPSALKGENAEAFSAAIRAGIPQTIRGVIWQVLADSRSPELEEVYRDLVARGTPGEHTRSTTIFSLSSAAGSEAASLHSTNGGTSIASGAVTHPPSISEASEPEEVGGESTSTERAGATSAATTATDTTGTTATHTATTSSSAQTSVRSGASTPTNGSATSQTSPDLPQDKPSPVPQIMPQSAEPPASSRRPLTKDELAALRRLEKAIRRDLGSRTSYSRYFLSQKNQDGLFGVCKAYALYDEEVGYAQGMNFIVMPLLFNMSDSEAFTLMVKLMNDYGMRDMFVQGMPGLHMRLYQFERLLEDLHPALACHLKRRGVAPTLYATQWFLTLFAYRFPLQLVLRIYDLIFEEGVESTILRLSVAIMTRNATTLLAMNDMASLTTFLKEQVFDVYIDKQPSPSSLLESGFFGSSNGQDKEVYRADVMVQDACDIRLTPEMIQTYTREWEETTRAQQAAAAELEGLKRTVNAQAAKIKHLEEQSERTDSEHVQLVSELVKLKVENEELMDQNEMMTVQVQELRNVLDKQQAELEEKMREEMDRAMQRNSEVHSQNRAMEEQLAEMERELVETKMKWAEVSTLSAATNPIAVPLPLY